MPEETLKQKTAKGLFWGGISTGVQQVLGMVFGIYLARILNAEDYGLVGMLAIFSGIAGTIVNSGFTVALTNKIDASHRDYNAVFWFSFFVGLGCYIILFFAAPLIAYFYNRPELTSLSRVIFVSFFFSGCSSVSYTVLFKNLMVKQQAQIDIIAMLLSGVVGVTLAAIGASYWALAFQSVTFICVGALLRFFISPWKPTLDIDFRPLKSMVSFSVKLFLTNIFQQINTNIFSVFLGKFYNATSLGFYSQGQKWAGMGNLLIVGMMNSVSQPVFVNVIDNRERLKNVLRKMLRFGAFVSFPAFLGLAFIAKEFIIITIGVKWLPCVPFLQLFCFWGLIAYIWNLFVNLLMSYGKSNLILYGTIFVGLLQLLSVIVALPYGVMEMAIGYVVAYYVGIGFWFYFVNKEVCLSLFDLISDLGGFLIVSVCSILVTYFLSLNIENVYLLILFKILLTAVLYIVILYLLKAKIFVESMNLIRKRKF